MPRLNDLNTEEKNAVISAQLVALLRQGCTAKEAFTRVLGPGSYESLASDIYDALRN